MDVKNYFENNFKNLVEFCDIYFNGIELFVEIGNCKMLLCSRKEIKLKTPLELSFIISYGQVVFPNLRVALQIHLIISVSIYSCEHLFSKSKLILTYL